MIGSVPTGMEIMADLALLFKDHLVHLDFNYVRFEIGCSDYRARL
jgi:hypothetical protein